MLGREAATVDILETLECYLRFGSAPMRVRLPGLTEWIEDPSRATELPEPALPGVLRQITDQQSRLATLGVVVAARLAGCRATPRGSGARSIHTKRRPRGYRARAVGPRCGAAPAPAGGVAAATPIRRQRKWIAMANWTELSLPKSSHRMMLTAGRRIV